MSKKEKRQREPSEEFIEPPLKAPPVPEDGYVQPKWEFPGELEEAFNLEPEFVATQKEFALSTLVNNM